MHYVHIKQMASLVMLQCTMIQCAHYAPFPKQTLLREKAASSKVSVRRFRKTEHKRGCIKMLSKAIILLSSYFELYLSCCCLKKSPPHPAGEAVQCSSVPTECENDSQHCQWGSFGGLLKPCAFKHTPINYPSQRHA